MTLASRVAGGLRGQSAPLAVALLVAANLVPLVGVLFLGWDVRTILVMYWLENGIIGALNDVRIVTAAKSGGQPSGPATRVGMAAFFSLHYGIFWVVHGWFVMVITAPQGFLATGFVSPLDAVAQDSGVILGAAALLVSHLASLVFNYFGRGEYKRVSPASQMLLPYVRVFVLHLTIILGGAVVIGLGQPALLVALLVLFKTVFDLGLHLLERKRYQAAAIPA